MTTDDALLALLDASPTLVVFDAENGATAVPNNVYEGGVYVDETEKVIAVPLPYLVFNSTPGYDRDGRMCGQVGGRVTEFSVKAVGATPKQAKWILDEARKVLSRKRLGSALIARQPDNLEVQREHEFTQPGGEPLFYGVDKYAVAV